MPIFVVNRSKHLERLQEFRQENFGILATFQESDNFLIGLRRLRQTYFIDSGVFEMPKNFSAYSDPHKIPWYLQVECYWENEFWRRRLAVAKESQLLSFIRHFLDRCDQFSPDYVIAPDIIHEPLLSLHLARLVWSEYVSKIRSYQLVGVVQVGYPLYETVWSGMNRGVNYLQSRNGFIQGLIDEYRNIGYPKIALGGLLRASNENRTGLSFGLSNEAFDELLQWTRPDFVLGGLALTRLPVLKKHGVWADSSGWIWWDSRYDATRFVGRDVMAEVFA
ncbi:MAG: hypothetical protein VKJ27_12170, partial [Synechocystis sp.]|nr:hypothetical protein [Synechocystis sp.]